MNENRTSGRDNFQVKIRREVAADEEPEEPKEGEEEAAPPKDDDAPVVEKKKKVKYEELECKVIDNQNGTYKVEYQMDEECDIEVVVLFEDDKGSMVPIRGSPYKASFVSSAKAIDNTMSGPLVQQNFKEEVSALTDYMSKKDKAISLKGKNVEEVTILLGVKE